MSTITNRKITDGQRNAVWVQHQQDRLTGTPQENKSVFDEYAELIREHFNGAMDDIDDALGDVSTDFGQIENRVEALEEINVEDAAQSARAYAESARNYASMVSDQLAEATSYASKHFKMTRSSGEGVPFAEFIFNPYGYAYSADDYYEVFVNGFKLNENEYSVERHPSTNMSIVRLSDPIEETGNVIEVCVTKFLDPATYVAQAQEYAEDAEASREDAEGWAKSAYGYAEQADASVTSISNVEERVRAVAVEVEGYRDDAEESANDAGNYASTASNKATQASESATQAQTYAGNASTSAGNAQTYAGNASTSATQASGYATNASTSATSAEDSAEDSEAWAVGQRGGVDVPSTDPTYENNSKYWAEQSQANQYGAYIVKSASGDIASFSDGGDDIPMKSVKVTITPKQSGSGDPSPSNVRAITGWTDADVTVAGKNIISNIAFGYVPSVVSGEIVSAQGWATDFIKIDNSNHICMSVGVNNSSSYLLFYDKQKTYLGYLVMYSSTTTPLVSTNFAQYSSAEYVKVRCDNASGVNPYAQLEVGTTATTYEPYNGHTTPVPLGQTVYGANGDAVSGAWKKTKNVADLGSLSWSYSSTYGVFIATFPNDSQPVTSTGRDAMCERYTAQLGGTLEALQNGKFLLNSTQISSGARLAIKDTAYTDAAVFKTAMDGVKFVYDLATPTDFTTTPVSVPSLLGTNNIWSDAGSVEVEYRADPTLAYAELQALILENL